MITSRGRWRLYAAAIGFLLFTTTAHADALLDAQTAACKTLDACMNVLHVWSRNYNGRIE